jgi:copper ion binding protein
MSTATFSTPSVHCGSCMATIEEAVGALDGVEATETDLAALQVRVTFDDGRIDPGAIAAAITDTGYEVASISA